MKTPLLLRIFGAIVAFLTVAVHHAAMADHLDIWRWRNPLPNASSSFNVQFLNGHFVGYGATPGLVISSDGTNWTDVSTSFNGAINQMAYGNGRYVIAGSSPNGPIASSSSDFVNWTSTNFGTNTIASLSCVAFGNGVFVAGSRTVPPGMWVSTNGVDWSQTSTQAVFEIAYGNGRFIATLYNLQVLVSTDGISWNPVTIDNLHYFQSVSFANGRFYAHGTYSVEPANYPALYFTTDGLNWSPAPDPTSATYTFYPFHALFGNGILLGEIPSYAAVGPLFVSTDGSNFVAIAANNFSNVGSSTFGNGVFVNSYLQTSADGTNWSASAISPATTSNYTVPDIFTATNGSYVAVTTPLSFLESSNGLGFTFITNSIPVSVSRVKFANGLFHAVGTGGTLARSTNGLDWVTRNSASANSLYDIEYGNSLWVAVGTNGTITASTTGNAWSLQTSGTSFSLNGIAYGSNLFVVVGNNGTVLTSSSGSTWTPQFVNTVETLDKVAYGNGQFVAVGAQGTIVTSPDGVNWVNQNSGTSIELSGVAFGDGAFCSVGTYYPTNVVLTSTDGITWTPRTTGTQHSLTTGVGIRFLNGTFFFLSEKDILQSGPVRPVQLQLTAGDTPTVTMQSSSGLLFRMQSAGTLTGPWQDLGHFTMPGNGSLTFPDASATSQPQKFYRAIEP
jgi:hypothetical protein